MSNLKQSGRNATMDRKFTTVPLAFDLSQEKITTVGTIRSDKRNVPRGLRPVSLKKATLGTVRFAFSDDATLVNYVPKKGKVVTVLSTQHHDMNLTEEKPDIILFYNSTKSGEDRFDNRVRMYSCHRNMRRCKMAVFFNLIDIVSYNSYVVFQDTHNEWAKNYLTKSSERI